MPDYTSEPAFQTITQSPEFSKFSPEKRKQVIEALGALSPEERQQFADRIGPPPTYNPNMIEPIQGSGAALVDRGPETRGQQARSAIPTAIDIAGQVGGAALGGMIGAPYAGGAAGSLVSNRINKGLGYRPGGALGPIDTSDLLSVGVPVGARMLGGLARATTKPAQKVITEADETNAANQAAYQQTATDLDFKTQQKLVAAKNKADTVNTGTAQDYTEYTTSAQEHAKNADILRQIPQGLPRADYKALYARVPKDTEVPLTNARQAAQSVVDQIDTQFPGFKDSSLYTKAKGILTYGKAPAEGVVDPAVEAQMRNRGQLPSQQATTPSEPRFEEAQQLLSDVGALKQTAEARDSRMRGLIRMLDNAVFQDVEATGAPGSALARANKAYSRSRTLDELSDVINSSITERRADQATRINPQRLYDNYQKFKADNPYYTKNLSPGELGGVDKLVESLTAIKNLKSPVEPPTPVQPDYGEAKFPSEYPKPPEPVEPANLTFPWGKAIMAKTGGAMLGGLLGERLGIGTYPGLVAGAAVGTASVGAPYLVSRILMASPQGQAIVRGVLSAAEGRAVDAQMPALVRAGKAAVNARGIAMLTAVAKQMGIRPLPPDETNKE